MFNFMKYYWVYFVISALVIVPGIISLVTNGLKPSIDFTGGTLIELQFASATQEDVIRANIPEGIELSSIQTTGDNTYLLRAKPINREQNQLLQSRLASAAGELTEIRYETVGPTLGKELLNKTFTAILITALAITLYVAYRFKELKYGISAVLAMFHDTLVLLGIFSLLGHFKGVEVDTLFVTAVLTTLSFSVHDTIVVYDRIRETLHHTTRLPFTTVVNKAVAETLSRSVNNSMTIIFMLLALWLLGGESIRWFVFALLVGTVTGTYSSTFTAAPLLLLWNAVFSKKKR